MLVMRTTPTGILIILACIVSLALLSCSVPKPARQAASETSGQGAHATADRTRDEGHVPSLVHQPIADLALDYISNLGFDISRLSVVQTDLMESHEVSLWKVVIDTEKERFAEMGIDEDRNLVESIKVMIELGADAPEVVRPGEDMFERVAQALNLEEQGYRKASYSSPFTAEYRKYTSVSGMEIATGRVIIGADPRNGGLQWIITSEHELPAVIEVAVDEDSAIRAAAAHLGDPGREASHTELAVCEVGGSRYSLAVCWEIRFGEMIVNIRADDGSAI